jgi:hypothetical protein
MNFNTWHPSGRVPIAPRGLWPARRFPILTLVASLSLLVSVAGCGDEPTTSAESGRNDASSASGTSSQRPSIDTANNAANV